MTGRQGLVAAWTVVLTLGVAAMASAQTRSTKKPRTTPWQLSGGITWIGGSTVGPLSGTETQPNGSPLALFTASSKVDSSAGFSATLARKVGGPVLIEATGGWTRPTLRTDVTGDLEGAAPATATNQTTEFSVVGAAVVELTRHSAWIPFVRGGAGWMRQLSDDQSLSSDGTVVVIGGGVKYWLGGRARPGQLGFRLDAGVVGRSGGVLPGSDKMRFAPSVAGSLAVRF